MGTVRFLLEKSHCVAGVSSGCYSPLGSVQARFPGPPGNSALTLPKLAGWSPLVAEEKAGLFMASR